MQFVTKDYKRKEPRDRAEAYRTKKYKRFARQRDQKKVNYMFVTKEILQD